MSTVEMRPADKGTKHVYQPNNIYLMTLACW